MRSGDLQQAVFMGEAMGEGDAEEGERHFVEALGEAFGGGGKIGDGVVLEDMEEFGGGAGPFTSLVTSLVTSLAAILAEQGSEDTDEGIGGEGGVYVFERQAEGGRGSGDPAVDFGGTAGKGGGGGGGIGEGGADGVAEIGENVGRGGVEIAQDIGAGAHAV